MLDFKPIDKSEIPRRGKIARECKETLKAFINLIKKEEVEAIEIPSDNYKTMMKYYDNFRAIIKRTGYPIRISVRKNPTTKIYLMWLPEEFPEFKDLKFPMKNLKQEVETIEKRIKKTSKL